MLDFVIWCIGLSYIWDIVVSIGIIIFLVVYVIHHLREPSWNPHNHKSKTNVKKRISDSKK